MKKSRPLLFTLLIIFVGFAIYKYYRFQRFFVEPDFYNLSILFNNTLNGLYNAKVIEKADEDSLKKFIFENYRFDENDSNLISKNLFFNKTKNDSTTLFEIGFKGEDGTIGGRKYVYLGSENQLNVEEETFIDYLFKNTEYDIIFSAGSINNEDLHE